MKKYKVDIIFILCLSLFLLLLTETDQIAYISRFPFIFLLAAYFIGKFLGRKEVKQPTKTYEKK